MARSIFVSIFLLFVFPIYSYCVDMALYIGMPNTGWYLQDKMLDDAKKITDGVKGIKEVKSFDDKALNDLKAWAEKNLKDSELDIIWLNGCMPSVLYPNPNKQPDGSLAELWLQNGNMFINVADWFAYCTYETGARGADNAAAGAENILNLPGIIRFGDGTKLQVTAAGKKYLPSIGNTMTTDRPIVGSAVKKPWEVAEVFAGELGADMDPCVLYNTETKGYMVFINQSVVANSVDRAKATTEFINNWCAEKLSSLFLSVDSHNKIAYYWGAIKKID